MMSHTEKFITMLLLFVAVILFSSCSQSYTQQDETKDTGDKTLIFSERENGKAVRYEVNFKDDEIISIYRDNEKVPDDKIDEYSGKVYNELYSIHGDHKPFVFHFDSNKFRENLSGIIGKIKNDSLKLKFDKEKFKAQMQKLKEELKDIDEIVIKIDKDKIKGELDKIKAQKFDFDFDFDFDFEEHNLNMKELQEEMNSLNQEMEELNKEMEELDKEMKILDEFLNDVKNELVKDGFINSAEDEIKLELSRDKMKINGETVSSPAHSKYAEIYKKHYGKEIDEKIEFHLN